MRGPLGLQAMKDGNSSGQHVRLAGFSSDVAYWTLTSHSFGHLLYEHLKHLNKHRFKTLSSLIDEMSNETKIFVVIILLGVIHVTAFSVYVSALCTAWTCYTVSGTITDGNRNLSAYREWPQLFFSRCQFITGRYCFSDVPDSECKLACVSVVNAVSLPLPFSEYN